MDPPAARMYIACGYDDEGALEEMRRRVTEEFGTIDFEASTSGLR